VAKSDLSRPPATPSSGTPLHPGKAPPSLGTKAREFAIRFFLGAAGFGLLIGFFMPWIHMGDLVVISGFSLVASSGQSIDIMSGPHRGLLFIVPLSAIALIASAISGHRLTAWVAILAGGLLISFGLYTLIRMFFSTTGIGMWLVTVSALAAFGAGLVGYGRESSDRSSSV